MIRDEFMRKLAKRHTLLVFLWVNFILADFLYVWVADFQLSFTKNPLMPGFSPMVRAALWIVAGAEIWLLHGFWKKRFLTKEALLPLLAMPKLPRALRDHASPLEERCASVVSFYFIFKLAAFGLAASVALCGFALAFWGHYVVDQYVLSFVSLALLVHEFPSKAFLQELVREVEIRGDPPQAVVKG